MFDIITDIYERCKDLFVEPAMPATALQAVQVSMENNPSPTTPSGEGEAPMPPAGTNPYTHPDNSIQSPPQPTPPQPQYVQVSENVKGEATEALGQFQTDKNFGNPVNPDSWQTSQVGGLFEKGGKVNSQGKGGLTPQEKAHIKKAQDIINRKINN
jgi:hypothetical protein